jgi:hypothetical protein
VVSSASIRAMSDAQARVLGAVAVVSSSSSLSLSLSLSSTLAQSRMPVGGG